MPRSISSASVKWPTSTWEVSYEPSTPDRAVHLLPTVAWIVVRHKCGNPPSFRPCPRPASQRCQCSRSACGCVPGQNEAGNQELVHQVELLAALLPICREPWLHHHSTSSDCNAEAATGIRSIHLHTGGTPSPSPGDRVPSAGQQHPGASDHPHDDSGVLWSWLALAGSDKPDSRRRGFEQVGLDHSEHEVRQDATGSPWTAI